MEAQNFITDYLLKQDCSYVRKRYRDFWQQKQLTYPLLYIKAQRPSVLPKFPIDQNKSRKELDLDLNWHRNHCRNQILGYDFLFDSMPVAVMMFGRDITNMGVLSGNDFTFLPSTEFISFQEHKDFLIAQTPEFRTEMPFVQKVMDIYRGVSGEIMHRACLNPPTTADAMTTMAMVLGMENFLRSLQKNPAQVKQKSLELNKLFYSFYNFIYEYLLEIDYGESASWFPVFAEGKFDSVRSDISVMLSENMFRDLSLPAIQDACDYLDYSMFNLDSIALIRFLQPLSEIKKLNGIYFNIEPWLYDLDKHIPVLKLIKELGFTLALPVKDAADAKQAVNKLGKSGLLLELPVFRDKDQAMRAGEAIADYAGRCLY